MTDLRLVRPQTLFVIQYNYSTYPMTDLNIAGQASDTPGMLSTPYIWQMSLLSQMSQTLFVTRYNYSSYD